MAHRRRVQGQRVATINDLIWRACAPTRQTAAKQLRSQSCINLKFRNFLLTLHLPANYTAKDRLKSGGQK